MPAGSPELTKARREEIVAACEQLYQTMSFKEITLKEIGKVTSFTRTSIYNYFQTKEEIFLEILKQEYEKWVVALRKITKENPVLSKEEFADKIAKSLEEREQLLKIMSMNLYDMEENSRIESLIELKKAYGLSMQVFLSALEQYFPEMSKEQRRNFIYYFFPFIYGIYPYTVGTEKQRTAMKAANVDYTYMSIYEITKNCLMQLL